MRILITGGAGFIGSHLLDQLVNSGHDITVLDNLRRGRLEHIEAHTGNKAVKFIQGDIRDKVLVRTSCRGIDLVFHLAAQSNVIGAVHNLDYSFETNVIGTYNVLKASVESGVSRFIFSSSREVYGEAQRLPVDEHHPLDAKNAYGVSKVAGEKYCGVFRDKGMDIIVLRLANVYGLRDYDRVIPIFLEQINKDKTLSIYGGKQQIDFVPVNYVTKVFTHFISDAANITCPVNVASGRSFTLFELIERLELVLNKKARVKIEPARTVEVTAFKGDISRLINITHLKPPADPLAYLAHMVGK